MLIKKRMKTILNISYFLTVNSLRGGRKVSSSHAESTFDALGKYAVDLVSRAEENKIDPVIGRGEFRSFV